jgi:hypothetical protein
MGSAGALELLFSGHRQLRRICSGEFCCLRRARSEVFSRGTRFPSTPLSACRDSSWIDGSCKGALGRRGFHYSTLSCLQSVREGRQVLRHRARQCGLLRHRLARTPAREVDGRSLSCLGLLANSPIWRRNQGRTPRSRPGVPDRQDWGPILSRKSAAPQPAFRDGLADARNGCRPPSTAPRAPSDLDAIWPLHRRAAVPCLAAGRTGCEVPGAPPGSSASLAPRRSRKWEMPPPPAVPMTAPSRSS